MILVECNDGSANSNTRRLVGLFGVGLIGQSIVAAIHRTRPYTVYKFSFTWNSEQKQLQELEAVQRHILAPRTDDRISQIDMVWAAGIGGFGASEDQITLEVRAFEKVLSFGLKLAYGTTDVRHSFHLLSSAGGLFEGQKHVNHYSRPRPLRPYSHGKIEQERMLLAVSAPMRTMIYRPSSVYGVSSKGSRLGLVNALIQNSVRHRTTNIVGNSQTIRDYVLASDVGQFVADKLRDLNAQSKIFTLASGKPTSIFEMLYRIEKILGRKLYFAFDKARSNAADTSFSRSVLPEFWCPTDLETGLRQSVRRLAALYLN
jgi:nucleoside-diphosphate-sugar epimerase